MSTKGTASGVRAQYEFIKAHRHKHSVQASVACSASPRAAMTRGSVRDASGPSFEKKVRAK